MFDDSALNRIVFVALLVNVERVILEAGKDYKDRFIFYLTELTCKHRLDSSDGHLA